MTKRQKDKLYKQLHKELAGEFDTTAKAIQYVRGGLGRGLTHKEIVDQHKELIENRNKTITEILLNIKNYKETIRLIENLSEDSFKYLIEKDIETSNKDD